MRIILAAILSLIAIETSAAGAYIVISGVVTSVANTGSNLDNFVVRTSGGTGTCTSSTFPRDAVPTQAVHDRAYAAALTALASGATVSIYNYEGLTCDRAAYISIAN